MANNPYVNKVVYGNNTLIDLTSDTVTADKLAQGYTAHDSSGAAITGTMSGSGWYTSTATLFNNYNSTKSAGYAEFPVIGEPKAFIIPYEGNLSGTPSYSFSFLTMYNIYKGPYADDIDVFNVKYRNASRNNTGSMNSTPKENGYVVYENGVLKVRLFSGVRFAGSAAENILIYIV